MERGEAHMVLRASRSWLQLDAEQHHELHDSCFSPARDGTHSEAPAAAPTDRLRAAGRSLQLCHRRRNNLAGAKKGLVLPYTPQGLPRLSGCRVAASRSVQLCRGCREHLASGKEGLVLPCAPQGLPPGYSTVRLSASCAASIASTTSTTASGFDGALHVRPGLRQLEGRLVCKEEGMVLQSARQGLCRSRRGLYYHNASLRLRRRL